MQAFLKFIHFLSTVAEHSAREHLIETGEITPFDAVNLKNDCVKKQVAQNGAISNQTTAISQTNQTRNNNILKTVPTRVTGLSLIDRIKASSREPQSKGEINISNLAYYQKYS